MSPPSPLLWLTISVFLAAFLASVAVAFLIRFTQGRSWAMPALVILTGFIDLAFAFKYAQLVIPGFPGGPIPSAEARPYFFLVALASLAWPIGVYAASYRELRLARDSEERMASEQRVSQMVQARLEAQLRDSQQKSIEQQEQFVELKHLIIGNVSHELRTPMTIILLATESVLSGTFGDVSESLQVPINSIDNNTRRMSAVVNRMVLSLRDPVFQSTDLAIIGRQLVESSDIWLNVRRQRSEVTITSNIPPHLPVWGDPEMLRMAVFELLNNAIKFGATAVRVSMVQQGNEIFCTVSDNGIGIPKKYHKKIFEPLFQVRMDSKRPHEGAGMGLAMVETVAHHHDGYTDIKSRLGQGATFIFVIPAQSSVPPVDVTVEEED